MKAYSVGKNFELKQRPKKISKINDIQKQSFVLAKYSNIGYYLIAPLLLGVFIGFWLDSYFNSKPVFVLVFLALGFVSTIYNLFRVIKDEQNNK